MNSLLLRLAVAAGAILALCTFGAAFAMPQKGNTSSIGVYSAAATILCGKAQPPFASPDGGAKITERTDVDGARRWQVETQGRVVTLDTEAWPCPEFLWAPDSSALAVTYRDGANARDSHMEVYRFGSDTQGPIDVTAAAETDFVPHHLRCSAKEGPNLAAIAWLDGADRLLLVVQVPRHSDCDDRGTFVLYEVSVPEGKVLAKYGQLEAKQRFGDKLGSELLHADDRCITQPGSCHAPYAPEKGDGVHGT